MSDQVEWGEFGSDEPAVRVPRQVSDILVLGVLSAVTFRILAQIVAGFIRTFTRVPQQDDFARLHAASVINWFADFGDGNGVLLAGVATGIAWWVLRASANSARAASVTDELTLSEADARFTYSARICDWLSAIWAATAVASVALVVSLVMAAWGTSEQWVVVAGDGGIYLSYGMIGVLGLYATRQLRWAVLFSADE
jgi:hypothetical protein